ncbi:MAG: putative DNA binding domain-containing protein [Acidobacteria bacterium]|nr:putative DNA binding domain-containing protein [Acidobacteriota bacterium]MBI3654822.1 putative DNA binding domain-containing protein [Acidobacteriota bacterium]
MFDSTEELLRKIRLGEDTSLELKAVRFRGERVFDPARKDLADELAGIANTHDGVLVLGVDDKTRDIVGIPADRLDAVERYVYEICNESIKPPVVFRSFRMELPDSAGASQPVLKVEVPRSLFVHKSPGGYFHRQGSSTREMPTDVLARLLQQRSQARLIRFDEQAVPQTSIADLDEGLWRRFLGPRADDETTVLHKMKLLTRDEIGQERATIAGVLMCSRAPEAWLPNAVIQAVRYRGTRQDSNYQVDAQEITGPMGEQIRRALAFVRRNMQVAARKDPARIEVPQFSMRAVFEATVNAVAHRDYSVHGSKIRLFLFDDRLELFSPGPLPNTVTVDSMALRQSTRNELLTTLLAKCRVEDPTGEIGRRFMMEKRGDGVPIILEESKKLSGREPEYRLIDDAELLLTIHSPQHLREEDEEEN